MTGALAIRGLTHAYGDRAALAGVDLDAEPGELVALVGPTGCGKSTVLRIAAGLLAPTAGTVRLDGTDLAGVPGRAALMPQHDALLPWRRARENAVLAVAARGGDLDAARRHADGLFARFGLTGFEAAWPHELSGGMRQRVALLRTVLVGAPLMLLDEPFAALDAITRADLQGWLGTLRAELPVTTLLVTHDVDEALRLADVVAVMSPRPGRVHLTLRPPGPAPRSPARLTAPDIAALKRTVLQTLADDGR